MSESRLTTKQLLEALHPNNINSNAPISPEHAEIGRKAITAHLREIKEDEPPYVSKALVWEFQQLNSGIARSAKAIVTENRVPAFLAGTNDAPLRAQDSFGFSELRLGEFLEKKIGSQDRP